MTMVDIAKPDTSYEQAWHNLMKIITCAKEDDKILFKSKETFYTPTEGPDTQMLEIGKSKKISQSYYDAYSWVKNDC